MGPVVEAAPVETVTLAFGWRDGWSADVETVGTSTKTTTGRPPRVSTHRVAARIDVGSLGDDVTVRWRWGGDDSETHHGDRLVTVEPGTAAAIEDYLSVPYVARIGRDGSWLGIVDEEATVAEMQRRLDVFVDGLVVTAPEEQREALARWAVSQIEQPPRVFLSRAEDGWASMIAFWAGATLSVGRWSEQPWKEPLSAGVTRYGLLRTEPCTEAAEAPTCAVVETRSTFAPRELARARQRALDEVRDAAPPEIRDEASPKTRVLHAERTETTTRWVEVDTLRPWRMVEEAEQTVRLRTGGEVSEERASRHGETTWTWR
jgi:hypothetical protein